MLIVLDLVVMLSSQPYRKIATVGCQGDQEDGEDGSNRPLSDTANTGVE